MADEQTLAQRIKAKYPDYSDIPDAELEQRILAKHPEYGDMPRTQAQTAPEAPPDEYGSSGFEGYAPQNPIETYTQALPIAGAAVGGALGNIPGAAVGAGAGRLVQQSINARYGSGRVPSTGAGAVADVGGEMAITGALGAAGKYAPALVNKVRPSVIKQGASQIYKTMESEVGNLPIEMKRSGPLLDEVASKSEWESWPTGLKKLYNRVTAPNKPGMTYSDANGIISELGSRAQAAQQRGLSNTARKYRDVQQAILEDTNASLEEVGRNAEYAKARGDWARAKSLEERYQRLKKSLPWVAGAIGLGGAASKASRLSDLIGNGR